MSEVEPEDPDDFPIIPLAGYGSFYLDALDDVAEDFDEDGFDGEDALATAEAGAAQRLARAETGRAKHGI